MELKKKLDLSVQKTRKFLTFVSGFIALSGLVNFVLLLLVPADGKNALLLGYSSKRLAILAFLFVGSVSFIIAGIKLSRTYPKTILAISNIFRKQGVSAFLILFFFLALLLVWVAGFSPEYLLRDYYAIGQRLLPLLIWLMSISVAALGFCIYLHNSALKNNFFTDRKYWRMLAVTTAVLILLFLFIAWIYPKLTDQLWFGRYSVPILATQIIAAWVLVSLGLLVPGNYWKKLPAFFTDHTDLIIFILIWVFTAFLWVNQPIEFMGELYSTTIEQHIKPLPPNFEIYPRKDSETYFYISESIVTGEGIYRSIDKSLFVAFEGLNNWLAGESYEKMLNLQTILLASFPAVIYLLGSKMQSRPAGLLAAALAVMQEVNGIRLMDEFPVVSSKVLLSEPFMQLWTAIIALSGFLAFKRSGNRQAKFFIILGGSLGLSALFRLNTVVVTPFIILVAFIYYFRDRKTMIWSISVFLIGVFLAFSPWMIHNAIKYGDPLAFIKAKVSGVIINNRYEKINKQFYTNNNLNDEVSEILNGVNGFLPINYAWNNDQHEKSTDLEMAFAGFIKVRPPIAILNNPSNIPQILVSIFRHSLNNIITSFSILPTSINIQDLFHGSRNQRFWGGYDTASYEGINPVILVINLLILSVGITSAIKNHQVIGLVPIAVYLGYHLSNGIAISSGNRYAQPASWIIFFYYAIGLISISKYSLHLLQYDNQFNKLEPDKSNQKNNRIGLIIVILCVLVIGSAPVIADLLPINRFPKINGQQIISTLFNEENLQNKEYGNNIKELFSFYKEESVSVAFGRVLTPILVNNEEFKLAYGNEDYGGAIRYLTFMNLGPGLGNIKRMIFYPKNQFLNIKNGSDAVIIYRVENENEAIAIGIIDPVFSSQISTYKDIFDIPLSNFYFSENIPEIE